MPGPNKYSIPLDGAWRLENCIAAPQGIAILSHPVLVLPFAQLCHRRTGWRAADGSMPNHHMLNDRDSLLRKLHELRSEHRDLDTVIIKMAGTGLDQLHVQRLKKRKLLLKDEIAWLESRLIPDNIA